MALDIIGGMGKLLNEKGETFDFGCEQNDLAHLIKLASSLYPAKKQRAAKKWTIWDSDLDDRSRDDWKKDGFEPTLLYAVCIIFDSSRQLDYRNFAMSTALQELAQDCFFVSQNTVYICVGPGTRKTVDPRVVIPFYRRHHL